MINFPLAFLSDYKQKSPSLTCVIDNTIRGGEQFHAVPPYFNSTSTALSSQPPTRPLPVT